MRVLMIVSHRLTASLRETLPGRSLLKALPCALLLLVPRSSVSVAELPARGPSTAHDFDFLLGDWEYTAESQVPGTPATYHGRWTGARTGDGDLVEDDYKAYDAGGHRVYLGVTIRAFDGTAKRWTTAFVQFKAFDGGGPAPEARWSLGTAWRDGDEMLEGPLDTSKPVRRRAHFFDIAADHFSWSMDRSNDGGRTWTTDYLHVQARRVPAPRQSGWLGDQFTHPGHVTHLGSRAGP